MKFDELFASQIAPRKASMGPLPVLDIGPLRYEAGAYMCSCKVPTRWVLHDDGTSRRCCSTECFAEYATMDDGPQGIGSKAKAVEWLVTLCQSETKPVEGPAQADSQRLEEQPQTVPVGQVLQVDEPHGGPVTEAVVPRAATDEALEHVP